jgi:GMP synthase-like glutamine amidotransferase
MADRIMRVNAYTTLDLVDAEAEGHGFDESAYATVNVTSPRHDPDHIEFALELDNTELETLQTHADRLRLDPEQARELAAALEEEADAVEAATE